MQRSCGRFERKKSVWQKQSEHDREKGRRWVQERRPRQFTRRVGILCCSFVVFFLEFLVVPFGMWDLSSLTRGSKLCSLHWKDSPNHWATREVLRICLLFHVSRETIGRFTALKWHDLIYISKACSDCNMCWMTRALDWRVLNGSQGGCYNPGRPQWVMEFSPGRQWPWRNVGEQRTCFGDRLSIPAWLSWNLGTVRCDFAWKFSWFLAVFTLAHGGWWDEMQF